ncbi:helix-turn-helix domain-containing protein [Radicibacter daui]|uniref:helix-turn-helix domain-containing protein n=1 Tax=Radicibacter daui TaxID=3064829 RepID=UPI004046F7CE
MTELLSRPASPGTAPQPVGSRLKDWRQRRRLSQLDLALEAGISARHLSFVETGRSRPSRDMLLMLAEKLEVPLRERNGLLVSAGFAPVFPQRRLDDPALAPARRAIELVLKGHEPYPALALDRHWHMVSANAAVAPLLEGVAEALLTPPVNVLRLSLHPDGLAPRIINLTEWRAHLLERLQHQIDLTADVTLMALMGELKALPAPKAPRNPPAPLTDYAGMVVPLRLRMAGGQELAFFSTTTLFGTPVDVTLAELAIEAFFPADAATAAALSAATAAK